MKHEEWTSSLKNEYKHVNFLITCEFFSKIMFLKLALFKATLPTNFGPKFKRFCNHVNMTVYHRKWPLGKYFCFYISISTKMMTKNSHKAWIGDPPIQPCSGSEITFLKGLPSIKFHTYEKMLFGIELCSSIVEQLLQGNNG